MARQDQNLEIDEGLGAPEQAMFDRRPISRRELWIGWPVLQRNTDFYLSMVGFPLVGAGAATVAMQRLLATPPVWQTIAAIVAGLLIGLFVFFEAIRGGINEARSRKALTSFDDVFTSRLHLRAISQQDSPMLPKVYDRLALELNGLPPSSPKREQQVLATGRWWGQGQTLTVTDRLTGEVLGFATLNGVFPDGVPEAGLSLGPWARGRGLAVEAIESIGKAAAGAGYPQLRMGTRPENTAMRRALERIGAAQTGHAMHRLPNGEEVASVWYILALTAADSGQVHASSGSSYVTELVVEHQADRPPADHRR